MRGKFGVAVAAVAALMLFGANANTSAADSEGGTNAARADASDSNLQVVQVTATRVVRSGFQAPTPVTVIGAEALARSAVTNFADEINKLPSLRGSATPATATINTTNAGSNFLDLRGLGNVRTLVLVNKRRFVPSNPEGRLDLNVIPAALIERVEVVTGGASAAWGSDAVAGVVNVITNDDLKGVRVKLQGGTTEAGGGEDFLASLAGGTDYAAGRGNAVLGVEYADNSGVENPQTRDWFRHHNLQIANPAATATNGLPQVLIASNVTASNAAAGGLINAGPLRGTEFLGGEATRQFHYGSNVGSSNMTDGDGVYAPELQSLVTPVKRLTVLGTTTFHLSDALEAFAEVSYSRTRSEFVLPFFTGTDFATTIRQDNAYLPAAVRTQMASLNLASFTMGRVTDDIPYNGVTNGNDVRRIAAGFNGQVFDSWHWSLYGQYGRTNSLANIDNVRINSLYALSVDAVRNPSGTIVCRSTLTNPTNGCVPVNLFGVGSPDMAAVDYFTTPRDLTRRLGETSIGADLSGTPISLWAGPVSIAAGAEYRRDTVDQTVSAEAVAGLLNLANSKPYSGSSSVKEVFLETVVPLLRDVPFAHSLDFNGAVRLTDYDLSGSATTWKLGATWEPFTSVRLRATRSHDIRAPNLSELLTGLSLSFATIFDPVTGQQVTNVAAPTVGNTALQPEIGDTKTVGIVLTPAFAPGLRFSADWYDIDLTDAIGTVGAQNVVNFCSQGATQFCSAITRDANGQLLEVRNTQFNLASTRTRGVDFDLDYDLPLARLAPSASGSLSLRLLATYVDRFTNNNGTRTIELASTVGSFSGNGGPRWHGLASAAYVSGPLDLALEGRYLGPGVLEPVTTYDNNRVASWVAFDLSAAYALSFIRDSHTQLFAKVQNVFDRDPPVAAQTTFPTDRRVYDVLGRMYMAGIRMQF